MATEKTASGRAKNYQCPYCDQKAYSIYSLNVHIAAKHPGEKTVAPGNRTTAKLKPFKKEQPQQEPREEPREEEDNEEGWDIYG